MPALTSVLAGAALVGGGISAFGSYQQGQETKRAQEYNASINEQESALALAGGKREADIIKQNQVLNEYRQRKELEISKGAIVGGYAKSGVSVGTGSPLDVMADSISNAELEIAIGNWNAKNEADTALYNSQITSSQKTSEANMRRLYGKSAATNATYQGVGTLLSSATQYGTAMNKEVPKTKIGS